MKTVRYRFERELERVTADEKAKVWLKDEFKTILERIFLLEFLNFSIVFQVILYYNKIENKSKNK